MAALDLMANSGSQAIAANTAETILQLTAAANHRVRIKAFSVTVAGTAALDLIVRVLRQSTSGTSGTTVTPVKIEPAAAETIQTAAATNFSAEPTAGNVLQYKRLQGSYEKIFPLGQEIIVEGGGRIGVEITCTATATVAAEILFEE
jgi:hypothetical protein